MKDILQDMVAHTHSLGFLNLVKVTGDDQSTQIDSTSIPKDTLKLIEEAEKNRN